MNILVNYDMYQSPSEDITFAINTLNGIQNYYKFLVSDSPLKLLRVILYGIHCLISLKMISKAIVYML